MEELTRSERRIAQINEKVSIAELLNDLGYEVDVEERQQQFPCDLHGDGQDNKPSARMYPDGQSWYCFACDATRDSVQTVRDKIGLGFIEALKWLEDKYNLDHVGWDPTERAPTAQDKVAEALRVTRSFAQDQGRVQTLLDNITEERPFPRVRTLRLWEVFDRVVWMVEQKHQTEREGQLNLEKLRSRIIEMQKETAA